MVNLYLLGCGVPTPTDSRFGTSYVLQINNDFLMFDCGPASTCKLVKTGLFPTQIDYLFFTHHHFDHNADYPCFLLCRWDQSIGRENQLQVFGPPPTVWMTDRLIGEDGAFSHDWKARIEFPTSKRVFENRGGTLPRPKPSVAVKDISSGEIFKKEGWQVIAAPAVHVQPYLESVAYRVETNDGTIVFAGDTEPCEAVSNLAYGTDVLVVNCWDHQDVMSENGEGPAQTGTLDSGNMAKESKAKKLVITHTGANICRAGSREKAVADIGHIFDGEIVFGEELMLLELW